MKLGDRLPVFTSLEARAKLQMQFEDDAARARGRRVQGGFILVVRAASGRSGGYVFSKYLCRPDILIRRRCILLFR